MVLVDDLVLALVVTGSVARSVDLSSFAGDVTGSGMRSMECCALLCDVTGSGMRSVDCVALLGATWSEWVFAWAASSAVRKAGLRRSTEILAFRLGNCMQKNLGFRLRTGYGPSYGVASAGFTRSLRTKTCDVVHEWFLLCVIAGLRGFQTIHDFL